MGTAPSRLVPGLWAIWEGEQWPRCESSMKEVVEGRGSGLVGFYTKDTLASKSFTISRNWLTLRGAVLPESARLQGIKA